MNYKKACSILGLPEHDTENGNEWTEVNLKKTYRRLALMYHPDKNDTPDANNMFHSLHEAYEYLMKYQGYIDEDCDKVEDDPNSNNTVFENSKINEYKNLLFSFIDPILKSEIFQDIKTTVLYSILDKISAKCEEKAIQLLDKLDKRVFLKIRELLRLQKDVFHISEDFLKKMDAAYSVKIQGDELIILNPFLDDLWENQLYRMNIDGKTYLVPLWHHELVYDQSGGELFVHCNPILPDGIEIDEKNNIHVVMRDTLRDIWRKTEIDVVLGKHKLSIPRNSLKMVEEQTLVFTGCGISRVNTKDIYDVSKKSDILVTLVIANE